MIHVRTAGADDAARVQRLLAAFAVHIGHPTDGGGEAGAARLLQEPLADVLLGAVTVPPAPGAAGLEDGADVPVPEPDGIAVVRYRYGWWRDGLDANLEDLYVDDAARGSGLGRALLDEVLVLARERRATRLLLDTREDNAAALALYRSVGFASGDERDGERELFLRLALTG